MSGTIATLHHTPRWWVLSRDIDWNGHRSTQFDFMERLPREAAEDVFGDVRVVVFRRSGMRPHVKWVYASRKRCGLTERAYRWLLDHYEASALRVDKVCSLESLAFHRAMREKGLVDRFTVSPGTLPDRVRPDFSAFATQ